AAGWRGGGGAPAARRLGAGGAHRWSRGLGPRERAAAGRALMTAPRAAAVALVLLLVGAAAWWLAGDGEGVGAGGPQHEVQDPVADAPGDTAPPGRPAGAGRWIIAGGGPFPDSNQVSIEDDLAALAALAPQPRVLFAGGPQTQAVQVTDPSLTRSLRQELGALFAPRAGRDATWRPTPLPAEGPATLADITRVIAEELAAGGDLFIYLAGHGEPGGVAAENGISTWGGGHLLVTDMATLLDTPHTATPRLVITSCFSGGFGELVFRGADPALGPADTARCGLFATTGDLESSGCDPNPDRRAHEGYAVHFLSALRGQAHDGSPLSHQTLDVDQDGAISLLEAHTHTRIVGRGV